MNLQQATFTLLLIIFARVSQSCENIEDHLRQVHYYEDLITRKINEAKNYKPPTNANEFRPKSDKIYDYGWYDFVIVGAGPTGSVVANRLSEICHWKVLILEAGGSPSEFSKIPFVVPYLLNSEFNWNYKSVPQKHSCLDMLDQKCDLHRGKVIGGTTGINGMLYNRGDKEDFNRWEALGNKGWSYKDVLPYFIKSENCQIDGDPDYHGKGGYWNVKGTKLNNPQFKAFVKANEELFNWTINKDYNGRSHFGFSITQHNIIRNKRQSVGTAFLESVKEKRKNLVILERAYVTKILLRNKTAYGVEFTSKGKLYHVRARKEVIMSAGGLISPKILMLSGIGPKRELTKFNISLVNDLPVGQILYDPVGFNEIFVQTNFTAPTRTLKQNVEEYLSFSLDYGFGLGYYSSNSSIDVGYPDFEILVSPFSSVKNTRPTNNGTLNNIPTAIDRQSSCYVYIGALHPKSVGSLKLASSDPYEFPLIDVNMLYNPDDIEVLYQAILLIYKLIDTPAMKAINARIIHPNYSQCDGKTIGSKDYWVCLFKALSFSAYSTTGTCRMGSDPKNFVVNSKLQVHGIQNLRVADISVFPSTISAPPTAAAVMIGEKVSDMIKIHFKQHVAAINNVFSTYS